MKTALQELEEKLKDNLKWIVLNADYELMDKLFIQGLEKEKEQLNVSFISGAIEALSYSTPVRDRIKDGYFENKAEQYFEYTYKTNNNERK